MRDRRLDILFEPLVMENLTVKNRFFMAPMGHTFSMDQLSEYLVARARGGVGMITTGVISVHPSGGVGEKKVASLETDRGIVKYQAVVKAVHEAGAKIIAQLNHAGRYAPSWMIGQQPVAPSAIASRYTGEMPRELSTLEAEELIEAFARAALRARKAGFDGVEFCGCSGYLISQFLSPLTNERSDKFGGDVLGRATFLLSILKKTRTLVGDDFNVCVKFDAEDGLEGGKTLQDSLLLAPCFVSAGADRLHIWAGWHEATRPMLPMFVSRGAFSYLAAAIKQVVDVPVATVGRINDPSVAAEILHKGEADLIGLARPLLSDPDFVIKTEEGRLDEIRRCTACCYCFDQLMNGMHGVEEVSLACAVNPELGREGEHLLAPVDNVKNIVVVGAGPAGLEAARVAARRGHNVTLFEREKRLGGMLHTAVIPPHKEELKNIIDYYTHQMELLPMTLRLGEECTPEIISAMRPDAVVVATGARGFIPPIPGIEKEHVVHALDVLRETVSTFQKVVIIGGGLIGLETAEFLAELGHHVTVVEMLPSIGADVGPSMRWGMISRLRKKMTIRTSCTVVEIAEGGVVVEDDKGRREEIPAGTVIVAAGLKSERGLASELKTGGHPAVRNRFLHHAGADCGSDCRWIQGRM